MPFPPDMVTVAAYVPALKPVLGTTVNSSSPSTAMLLIVSDDNMKLAASSPESATINSPVGLLPVLLTVTL
jgi:hypothetical protein